MRFSVSTIILFITLSAYCIPTDSVFIKLPASILPTLSGKQRYELAEYFKAGKKDSVQNLFGKNAILQKYDTTNCHIILKTSATGITEIKRFYKKDNSVYFGIINTIIMPVKYSYINFYNEYWEIKHINLSLPETTNWIDKAKITTSNIKISWINALIDKKFFSMKFSDSNELEIQNNVLSTLSMDDRKMIEPFFIDKNQIIQIKE